MEESSDDCSIPRVNNIKSEMFIILQDTWCAELPKEFMTVLSSWEHLEVLLIIPHIEA